MLAAIHENELLTKTSTPHENAHSYLAKFPKRLVRIQIGDKDERDTDKLMHVMQNNIHNATEEQLCDMERSQGMIVNEFKRKHKCTIKENAKDI